MDNKQDEHLTMPGQIMSQPAEKLDDDEALIRRQISDTQTALQQHELTTQQKAAEHESFYTSKRQYLTESKKDDGKADSPEYMALQETVTGIVIRHRQAFTGDPVENAKRVGAMIEDYKRLIAACDAYVGKSAGSLFHGRFSRLGRQRQDMADQLRDEAEKDLGFLTMLPYDRVAAFTKETSWSELLGEARMETMEVSTQTVSDISKLSTIGGITSENYILPPAQAGGKKLFFKKEDRAKAHFEDADVEYKDPVRLRMYRELLTAEGIPEELIVPLIAQPYADYKPSPDLTPAQWALYIESTQKAREKIRASYEMSKQMDIIRDENDPLRPGSEYNTTRRNVATSRMAALLGVGDLVAKSTTLKITDGKQTLVGNAMEEAPGERADFLSAQYGSDCVPALSGKLLRQLTSLQVLDNICGQADRNFGNILIEKNADGSLGSMTGIDNDISFGTTHKLDLMTTATAPAFKKARGQSDYHLEIPHMSRELASSILELQPDTVRLAMKDLITDAESEALCFRLEAAQKAITAALAQPNSDVFLSGESAWDRAGLTKDFDPKPGNSALTEPGESYVRTLLRRLNGDISGGGTTQTRATLLAQDATEAQKRADEKLRHQMAVQKHINE